MWYVIHTMSGQEQDCKLQCERYVDGQAYQELFIPQYIAQKHFRKEWHDVKKTLFGSFCLIVNTSLKYFLNSSCTARFCNLCP